jgi:hypothetical protein
VTRSLKPQTRIETLEKSLDIDDQLMLNVKQEAVRQGRTMSEFIESALRLALQSPRKQAGLKPLPTFRGRPFLTNIADNDALQDLIEDR